MSKSGKVFNEKKISQSGMFNTLNLPDQLLITHYSLFIIHYSFPLLAFIKQAISRATHYSLFITHSLFQPISAQKNFPRATHY